jgi:hypothetical protein
MVYLDPEIIEGILTFDLQPTTLATAQDTSERSLFIKELQDVVLSALRKLSLDPSLLTSEEHEHYNLELLNYRKSLLSTLRSYLAYFNFVYKVLQVAKNNNDRTQLHQQLLLNKLLLNKDETINQLCERLSGQDLHVFEFEPIKIQGLDISNLGDADEDLLEDIEAEEQHPSSSINNQNQSMEIDTNSGDENEEENQDREESNDDDDDDEGPTTRRVKRFQELIFKLARNVDEQSDAEEMLGQLSGVNLMNVVKRLRRFFKRKELVASSHTPLSFEQEYKPKIQTLLNSLDSVIYKCYGVYMMIFLLASLPPSITPDLFQKMKDFLQICFQEKADHNKLKSLLEKQLYLFMNSQINWDQASNQLKQWAILYAFFFAIVKDIEVVKTLRAPVPSSADIETQWLRVIDEIELVLQLHSVFEEITKETFELYKEKIQDACKNKKLFARFCSLSFPEEHDSEHWLARLFLPLVVGVSDDMDADAYLSILLPLLQSFSVYKTEVEDLTQKLAALEDSQYLYEPHDYEQISDLLQEKLDRISELSSLELSLREIKNKVFLQDERKDRIVAYDSLLPNIQDFFAPFSGTREAEDSNVAQPVNPYTFNNTEIRNKVKYMSAENQQVVKRWREAQEKILPQLSSFCQECSRLFYLKKKDLDLDLIELAKKVVHEPRYMLWLNEWMNCYLEFYDQDLSMLQDVCVGKRMKDKLRYKKQRDGTSKQVEQIVPVEITDLAECRYLELMPERVAQELVAKYYVEREQKRQINIWQQKEYASVEEIQEEIQRTIKSQHFVFLPGQTFDSVFGSTLLLPSDSELTLHNEDDVYDREEQSEETKRAKAEYLWTRYHYNSLLGLSFQEAQNVLPSVGYIQAKQTHGKSFDRLAFRVAKQVSTDIVYQLDSENPFLSQGSLLNKLYFEKDSSKQPTRWNSIPIFSLDFSQVKDPAVRALFESIWKFETWNEWKGDLIVAILAELKEMSLPFTPGRIQRVENELTVSVINPLVETLHAMKELDRLLDIQALPLAVNTEVVFMVNDTQFTGKVVAVHNGSVDIEVMKRCISHTTALPSANLLEQHTKYTFLNVPTENCRYAKQFMVYLHYNNKLVKGRLLEPVDPSDKKSSYRVQVDLADGKTAQVVVSNSFVKSSIYRQIDATARALQGQPICELPFKDQLPSSTVTYFIGFVSLRSNSKTVVSVPEELKSFCIMKTSFSDSFYLPSQQFWTWFCTAVRSISNMRAQHDQSIFSISYNDQYAIQLGFYDYKLRRNQRFQLYQTVCDKLTVAPLATYFVPQFIPQTSYTFYVSSTNNKVELISQGKNQFSILDGYDFIQDNVVLEDKDQNRFTVHSSFFSDTSSCRLNYILENKKLNEITIPPKPKFYVIQHMDMNLVHLVRLYRVGKVGEVLDLVENSSGMSYRCVVQNIESDLTIRVLGLPAHLFAFSILQDKLQQQNWILLDPARGIIKLESKDDRLFIMSVNELQNSYSIVLNKGEIGLCLNGMNQFIDVERTSIDELMVEDKHGAFYPMNEVMFWPLKDYHALPEKKENTKDSDMSPDMEKRFESLMERIENFETRPLSFFGFNLNQLLTCLRPPTNPLALENQTVFKDLCRQVAVDKFVQKYRFYRSDLETKEHNLLYKKPEHFTIIDTAKDGECFYSAVGKALHLTAQDIKQKIVDELQAPEREVLNQDFYEYLINHSIMEENHMILPVPTLGGERLICPVQNKQVQELTPQEQESIKRCVDTQLMLCCKNKHIWANELIINIVSRLMQVNIGVIQKKPDGKYASLVYWRSLDAQRNKEEEQILPIFYNGRNHYDAVSPSSFTWNKWSSLF